MSAVPTIACVICGVAAIWSDEVAYRTGSWGWRLICWLFVIGAVVAMLVALRGAVFG